VDRQRRATLLSPIMDGRKSVYHYRRSQIGGRLDCKESLTPCNPLPQSAYASSRRLSSTHSNMHEVIRTVYSALISTTTAPLHLHVDHPCHWQLPSTWDPPALHLHLRLFLRLFRIPPPPKFHHNYTPYHKTSRALRPSPFALDRTAEIMFWPRFRRRPFSLFPLLSLLFLLWLVL